MARWSQLREIKTEKKPTIVVKKIPRKSQIKSDQSKNLSRKCSTICTCTNYHSIWTGRDELITYKGTFLD